MRLDRWIDRNLNYGREAVEAFLRLRQGAEVIVDLGAGYGTDLEAARRVHPAARLHAVECESDKCHQLLSKGVMVWELNIERDRLPFSPESVDIIVANQVLEHLKELFWVFHEISRVLKLGGLLIVGVPNLASLHNRFLLLTGRQPTVLSLASAHVRGFTLPGLLQFLDRCFPGGYKMVARTGANFYPFPRKIATLLAKTMPGLAWGLVAAFEKCRPYRGEFVEFVRNEKLETNFYLGSD